MSLDVRGASPNGSSSSSSLCFSAYLQAPITLIPPAAVGNTNCCDERKACAYFDRWLY